MRLTAALAAAAWLAAGAVATQAQTEDPLARGAYIYDAAGCASCHTSGDGEAALPAGGDAIKTPFGIFYAPNITPDAEHGIGMWREQDFTVAMTEGRSPDGDPYYPVFPYTSYTRIAPDDLAALWRYLKSLPPAATPNRPHELDWPFSERLLNWGWRTLYFHPGPQQPDPGRSAEWNRGAYLVEALTHCSECHTPRNPLGGTFIGLPFAGNEYGPDGKTVPNITPDPETGIGKWSLTDITWLLKTGFTPDGDDMQGTMAELIEHSTSRLIDDDRRAIAVYLKSLPAIKNQIGSHDHDHHDEDHTESEYDEW